MIDPTPSLPELLIMIGEREVYGLKLRQRIDELEATVVRLNQRILELENGRLESSNNNFQLPDGGPASFERSGLRFGESPKEPTDKRAGWDDSASQISG